MTVRWLDLLSRGPRAVRDLSLLGKGLEAVAEGRIDCRLEPGGLLADEFNRMAGHFRHTEQRRDQERIETQRRLLDMMHAQEHLRGTLEEKVRERTDELQRAYEELKKIDAMKDAFISSVSHELRTPLSSIRSFSEILLNYDEDPGTRREFIGIIKQESERLTRLINDVLDLAKIESGEMVWQIDAVSMPDLCHRAIGTVRVLAEGRHQRLELDIPVDLPQVMADPDRVIQVLTNLLANAVKFTPDGGRVQIRVDEPEITAAGSSPPMIRVTVADDGVGIPSEQIGTIFERFKQAGHVLTDKPTGTGLGLPISREIIRHLGGTLWATSERGEGSRFFFTLPVARPAPDHVERRPGAGELQQGSPRAREPRPDREGHVLLVAGETAADEDLRGALRARGIETSQVRTVAEGIEHCSVARPDLILLRPPPEGIEAAAVLRRLRESPSTTGLPVFLFEERGGARALLAAGPDRVVSSAEGADSTADLIRDYLREHRRWVAVVDDEAGTVEVLSEMLRLRGYGVVSAYDGEEAIRMTAGRDLELMILDLNLPRKSGWKVLEALRAQEKTRSLPVIVLTGTQTEMDRARALALGALEFLEKGHGLERLASEIDLLVQRRRAASEEASAGGE